MAQLYPDFDNITNVSSAMEHANTVSQGALGIGIPVSLFLIVMIVGMISKAKMSNVFTAGSILFTISSAILAWGGYLNPFFVIAGAIISGLGVMWVRIENKGQ
jgi:E3 ubiquitin-protein ligase DOA10